MKDYLKGFVAVSAVIAGGLIVYHSAQQSDNRTLICREAAASQIIATHVRIERKDGVYVLTRDDGLAMTYGPSAFAWCASMPDSEAPNLVPEKQK